MLFFKKSSANHSSDFEDFRRIIGEDTPFAIRESFRTLYTNVLYLPIEDKCKKIAITSAFSGEGKTYVTVNLALTIAKNAPEQRVLIVDADMRNPRVTRILNMRKSGRHGLSEFLAGIDEEPAFLETEYPNLWILPSGAKNSNTLGLISSTKMKTLIDLCQDKFDYILFDTPPVNLVSDGVLLNDYINGYLLIARADYSDISSVSDMLDALERVNANVFGFVLSSVNMSKTHGRYGKYGRYGRYGRYSAYYYDKPKSRGQSGDTQAQTDSNNTQPTDTDAQANDSIEQSVEEITPPTEEN